MTRKAWNKGSLENFLSKAEATHGSTYDYSRAVYGGYHTKLTVVCTQHGEFLQKPSHHLAGIGCPACGKDKAAEKLKHSLEEFIDLAKSVHGSRYDYSLVEYKNRHQKVKIICSEHGAWLSEPNSHITGSGCPGCAVGGFSSNKRGVLYVLVCDDITKVGVTNRAVVKRVREINTSSGKKFTVLKTYEMDGESCISLESESLKFLRGAYLTPNELYAGSTECFIDADRTLLLNFIDNRLQEILNE